MDHTRHVESERLSLEWSPGERLTLWIVLDLPRAAWIVERRAGELTAEERQIVREARLGCCALSATLVESRSARKGGGSPN
jgi:hypothetical protein